MACAPPAQLGRFSGSTAPAVQISETGVMLIRWTSDKLFTANGWSARWDSVGGYEFKAPLLGVMDGRRPLRVVVPRFTAFVVAQSAPVANAFNTLTVTLGCNVDFYGGSTATISGLTLATTSTKRNASLGRTSPQHSSANWSACLSQQCQPERSRRVRGVLSEFVALSP